MTTNQSLSHTHLSRYIRFNRRPRQQPQRRHSTTLTFNIRTKHHPTVTNQAGQINRRRRNVNITVRNSPTSTRRVTTQLTLNPRSPLTTQPRNRHTTLRHTHRELTVRPTRRRRNAKVSILSSNKRRPVTLFPIRTVRIKHNYSHHRQHASVSSPTEGSLESKVTVTPR